VGVAVSLPWSTSATGIFIALWLVAALATLDIAAVRRELTTAAGGLPALLWVLAAVGMLWADTAWSERLHGLGGFNKLLVVPLLLAHFRRSEHGIWVLFGFLASELGVLLLSWALVLIPGLPWRGRLLGVPVKDYLFQSEDFLICAFVLFERAFDERRAKRVRSFLGLLALALLFLANIVFVAAGRTVLLIAPVLLLLLGWRQFGWKGLLGAGLLGGIFGVSIWFSSPYLHQRIETSIEDWRSYRTSDAMTSTALHLDFLSKSLSFVMTAPIIGHGTGSIPEQFRNGSVGQTGASSMASANPHNQVFAVAIQLGLLGVAVVVAMWTAHVMLFRGNGVIAWIGMIIVVQNVVASLVNSHLFDFSQGWLYVFGVGVVGGMSIRQHDSTLAALPVSKP
jgi:O-antigen ligase